ncbi:RidA family protein [Microbacteriaceae bacterium VKM Ac-2855]|nr:RidA family protein [Microbacteriaceae bacterium VKM Ac-2855]
MGKRTDFVRSSELAPMPYAAAGVVSGGLVFVAGACPIDSSGAVVPGGLRAQAEQTLRNLAIQLGAAGASFADVVSTRVSVATTEHAVLVAGWDLVHAAFAEWEPPSTLVGVTVLGYPGQLIEIEAVAAIGAE